MTDIVVAHRIGVTQQIIYIISDVVENATDDNECDDIGDTNIDVKHCDVYTLWNM